LVAGGGGWGEGFVLEEGGAWGWGRRRHSFPRKCWSSTTKPDPTNPPWGKWREASGRDFTWVERGDKTNTKGKRRQPEKGKHLDFTAFWKTPNQIIYKCSNCRRKKGDGRGAEAAPPREGGKTARNPGTGGLSKEKKKEASAATKRKKARARESGKKAKKAPPGTMTTDPTFIGKAISQLLKNKKENAGNH